MTIGYKKLSDQELVWRENRARIEQQGKFLLKRLLNEALAELDVQFLEELAKGNLLELDANKEDLKALLLRKAQTSLVVGSTTVVTPDAL
jgi:hypothetical protein